MRKNRVTNEKQAYKILTLDDDVIMTETLQAYFMASGYQVDIENDPHKAIERVRQGDYDIMLLDFLMHPICGDVVVEEIRKFNTDLYIILLTGHKSMAPPIKTIRELDIQAYYEKSERFDQLELLVESCVKSINQMRTIQGYRDGLHDILREIPSIYKLQTIEKLLRQILQYSMDLLQTQNGYISVAPATLLKEAVYDANTLYFGMGKYVHNREAIVRRDMDYARLKNYLVDPLPTLTEHKLVMPIVNDNEHVGGIICVEVDSKKITPEVQQMFSLYIKQAASAISNLLLHTLIQGKNQELEDTYSQLQASYMEMVTTMRSMVDAKDIYTRGHSDRVAYYGQLLARALGKDDAYCERIRIAGLFHDVGKIGMADAILQKESSLSDTEYEEMKNHCTRGREILSYISQFSDILDIVECHHERYDGRGYPRGIEQTNIPEGARIISVVDAFDAMTSDRLYSAGRPIEQAIGELQKGRYTQFDGEMVDVFVQILQDYEIIKQEIEWTFA